MLRAWNLTKSLNRPYAETVGLSGIEAYAVNAAVVHWGRSFDNAIEDAVSGSKTQQEAERKATTVIRRWVPSTRQYR